MIKMVNIGTISMIILFCVSVYLWIGGYESALATILTVDRGTEQIEWSEISSQIQTALAIAVAGAIAGYFTGSGILGYALFSGIASFLFSFALLPLSIMNETSMPFEIRLLVGGVFSLTMMLAMINWMKGSEI